MNKQNKYIEEIKQEVLRYLADEDVSIALFGSRARDDARPGSDVDIALIPEHGYDRRKLVLLREHLEQMNTPYKVELVELNQVSETFREQVMSDMIWWKLRR